MTYEQENAKINAFIKENASETIAWLNANASRRWDNKSGDGYNVEFQQCRLGGYCSKGAECEKETDPRNWKDWNDEKSEEAYFAELCQRQDRTEKVNCDCEWVKEGEQRVITFREKGRRNWDSDGYNRYCEQHAAERAEAIRARHKQSRWNPLRNEPIWAENWNILSEKKAQAEKK